MMLKILNYLNTFYNKLDQQVKKFKMISKNLQIKKIMNKFEELKNFDTDFKRENTLKQKSLNNQSQDDHIPNIKKQRKEEIKNKQIAQKQKGQTQQVVYTQSQIARQVSKLKPYLARRAVILTTDEQQQLQRKKISQQSYKLMSDLTIYQNKKLCQLVDKAPVIEQQIIVQRKQKQKEGWIFQVFHRSVTNLRDDITRKIFVCGYAVMTDSVQIFESLTFQKKLITINPSQITMVKYEQQANYQVMTIQQQNFKVQCGFLNPKKFDLFDRMLFLQKNMSRSTSNRLFQNQLIKSIYSQYQKS